MARSAKADEMYNARRRVRRVINNLRNNLDSFNDVGRRSVERYIASAERLVERSLARNRPKNLTEKERKRYDERIARELAQVGQVKTTTRQTRANKITQNEMNLASMGDKDTSLGGEGLAKVKIFYKATEDLWLGVPLHKRNEVIMEKLGVSSLKAALEIVLAGQEEALAAAEEYFKQGGTGPAPGDGGIQGSYDWMAYVNKIYA